MQKHILTIIFLFLSVSVFSQEWSIGGGIGYATNSMELLKSLQTTRQESSPLPLKTTDNYPATPFYRIEGAVNDLNFISKIGLFYTFNSTGARSTVSDYSGIANLDAVINASQLGISLQKNLNAVNNYTLGIYSDLAWIRSSLRLEDYLKITSPQTIQQKNEYKFTSNGFSLEPGICFNYRFGMIGTQLNVGYLLDFNGKLIHNDDNNMWLQNKGQNTEAEWRGLRAGVHASFYF